VPIMILLMFLMLIIFQIPYEPSLPVFFVGNFMLPILINGKSARRVFFEFFLAGLQVS
jgi:hypothetical protein